MGDRQSFPTLLLRGSPRNAHVVHLRCNRVEFGSLGHDSSERDGPNARERRLPTMPHPNGNGFSANKLWRGDGPPEMVSRRTAAKLLDRAQDGSGPTARRDDDALSQMWLSGILRSLTTLFGHGVRPTRVPVRPGAPRRWRYRSRRWLRHPNWQWRSGRSAGVRLPTALHPLSIQDRKVNWEQRSTHGPSG